MKGPERLNSPPYHRNGALPPLGSSELEPSALASKSQVNYPFFRSQMSTLEYFIFEGSKFLGFQNWTYLRGYKFAVRQIICPLG